MSIPVKSAPTTSSTTTWPPSHESVRPADLALAKKRTLSRRKVPFRKDRPHHGTDLSRGAEDPDLHGASLVAAPLLAGLGRAAGSGGRETSLRLAAELESGVEGLDRPLRLLRRGPGTRCGWERWRSSRC